MVFQPSEHSSYFYLSNHVEKERRRKKQAENKFARTPSAYSTHELKWVWAFGTRLNAKLNTRGQLQWTCHMAIFPHGHTNWGRNIHPTPPLPSLPIICSHNSFISLGHGLQKVLTQGWLINWLYIKGKWASEQVRVTVKRSWCYPKETGPLMCQRFSDSNKVSYYTNTLSTNDNLLRQLYKAISAYKHHRQSATPRAKARKDMIR